MFRNYERVTPSRSRAEHLICNDEQLASMDRELAALYKKALERAPDKVAFRREGMEQLKARERDCTHKPCLVDWFSTRLDRMRLIAAD
jgi:uncharacterized protein